MCTVSIVPHRDGLRVMSNRDERRDRATALEPRVEMLGSRAATMPIDPVGGGSWIGVNDRGLVAAVLNRHRDPIAPRASCVSRGTLVRLALGCDSIDDARHAVGAQEAARFQPFTVVLVQRTAIAMVASNAREMASVVSALDAPLMFTASSLGDVLVDAPRRRLFEWLMIDPEERLDRQALFHGHQWPDKRDISVLMERADAATVSRTTIDVGARSVTLEYESLLPARAARRLEHATC
jgi:hypothetical protein